MRSPYRLTLLLPILAVLLFGIIAFSACNGPKLADPYVGTLELVTPSAMEQAKLNNIDGLAFDFYGNLFGVLEISGSSGGVVYIDKDTGVVTPIISGIIRADQIALHPSGDFFVTSETSPSSMTDRVYRIMIGYNEKSIPVAEITTAVSITTLLGIDKPEGQFGRLRPDHSIGIRRPSGRHRI